MADWPTLEELKQVLDVTDDNWDGDSEEDAPSRLEAVRLSAIERVKADVGVWAEDDEPDVPLARAALRMAELMALRPESSAQFAAQVGMTDPAYQHHMFGHHKRFPIG